MKMRSKVSLFFVWSVLILSTACHHDNEQKVLVFFQYQNNQPPAGVRVIQQMATEGSFAVDTTSQVYAFTDENLKNYRAVVFLGVPADSLNVRQQTYFERFVQAGGGYVGVSAPINTQYTWPWYEGLLQQSPSEIENPEYNTPVELTANKEKEPSTEGIITWQRPYDGGQAFYMAGQEVSAALASEREKKLVAEGIRYAMANNSPNYDLARSLPTPDENRFVKHTLVPGPLDEPTELTVLPDEKVVFVERKGAVKMYFPDTEEVKTIGQLNVHTKFEDGLMGVAKDPDFYHNHWIYMYYSPEGDESVQHLSRFLLLGDSLIMASEKLILKVDVQREECCHTGGSIAFGPDGNLFLSTGDDTNPFQSDGYAPIDERPGRAPFDAQGSAGNTNDLRGKVIRIRVNDDATYSIPDGNLFPKDGSGGRPEIYTMGTRNSYRISVDQETGWLYWGDVGNDARVDSLFGPKGYDEINQAKQAGNFGWPYFRGNQAYRDRDFATDEVGDFFDFEAPVNESPNNTGARVLPPFQKALIWYPYDTSATFPMLKTGGRNAMAGPVYHYDHYAYGKKRFPEYYNDKLFIYDWMRGWIMAVTLDDQGDLVRIEPFMDSTTFHHAIDMEMGPNGDMYILEYGADWFAANPDASLSKIDYSKGNRAPVARIAANKTVGAAPFTVNFFSEGSFDYDPQDELLYEWYFGGEKSRSDQPNPEYTFEEPGTYEVRLVVKDNKGEDASKTMNIEVGNEPPVVDIALAFNTSFYWDDAPIQYQVEVDDREDGSLAKGNIDPKAITFSFDFIPSAINSEEELGHKIITDGYALIEKSGCKACHSYEKQSVGPAYQAVAARYPHDEKTTRMLVHKILNGGGGNWGDRAMPAQTVTEDEAQYIVDYILALDEKSSLPLAGNIDPTERRGNGSYEMTVKYTDQGGEAVGPLTSEKTIMLRSPKVQAEDSDEKVKVRENQKPEEDYAFVGDMKEGSYLMLNAISLENIQEITFRVAATAPGITLSIKSADGQAIATAEIPDTKGGDKWTEIKVPITNPPSGRHDLYFATSVAEGSPEEAKASIDWIYFEKDDSKPKMAAK